MSVTEVSGRIIYTVFWSVIVFMEWRGVCRGANIYKKKKYMGKYLNHRQSYRLDTNSFLDEIENSYPYDCLWSTQNMCKYESKTRKYLNKTWKYQNKTWKNIKTKHSKYTMQNMAKYLFWKRNAWKKEIVFKKHEKMGIKNVEKYA